jgi:hypothetical protein
MPQQVREVVADYTIPIVQVGMAHPARLDANSGLARAWIRNRDLSNLR